MACLDMRDAVKAVIGYIQAASCKCNSQAEILYNYDPLFQVNVVLLCFDQMALLLAYKGSGYHEAAIE